MKQLLALFAVTALALGCGSDEKRPAAPPPPVIEAILDGPFSVTLTDYTTSTSFPNDPDIDPFVSTYPTSRGVADLMARPGGDLYEVTFDTANPLPFLSGLPIGADGVVDFSVTYEEFTFTAYTETIRVTGIVTQDGISLDVTDTIDVPEFGQLEVTSSHVEGLPLRMADPTVLDGTYEVVALGGTYGCPVNALPTEESEETVLVTRLGSSFVLQLGDGLSVNLPTAADDGWAYGGTYAEYDGGHGGIVPLNAYVEGNLTPDQLDLAVTVTQDGDEDCGYFVALKGKKWVPNALAMVNDYRVRYAFTQSETCGLTGEELFATVAVRADDEGELSLTDELLGEVTLTANDDGSYGGIAGVLADDGFDAAYSVTFSEGGMAYRVDFNDPERACTIAVDAEGLTRYQRVVPQTAQ